MKVVIHLSSSGYLCGGLLYPGQPRVDGMCATGVEVRCCHVEGAGLVWSMEHVHHVHEHHVPAQQGKQVTHHRTLRMQAWYRT